jgi:hypothetical protein
VTSKCRMQRRHFANLLRLERFAAIATFAEQH